MYDLHNDDLEFVWDPAKELANRRKHGVSFGEAATSFVDDRGSQPVIRIISARKADRREASEYARN